MQRWRPIVRLHARDLLGREFSARADSSDVVQEAMVQACRRVDQFHGETETQWAAWLRRILKNEAAQYRRQHLASMRTIAQEAGPVENELESGIQPLDRTIEMENMVAVAAAIDELPLPMREIVIRRAFHHHSFKEIAESMNRTPGVVRVIWARALRKLRDALRDTDETVRNAGGFGPNSGESKSCA